MTRRLALGWICGVLLLAGCAGYKLGPAGGETAGARSIQVEPFINKTVEPRLNDALMVSMRERLVQDGTYHVNTHDEGDIIVSGVITSYQRNAISVQSSDVLTALDYEITMTVQMTARERSSGKVLFDKPVKGRTILRAGVDLPSSERQAIPILTDDLARNATSLLVDGTW